jgi:hypothetical protein
VNEVDAIRCGFSALVVVVFGAGLPALAIYGGYSLRRARRLGSASTNWPATRGRVVESRVDDRGRSETGTDFDRFMPYVRYTYRVEGREYEGDTRAFGARGVSNIQDALAMAARYSKGGNVDVYFDPLRPGTSVLEPGADTCGFFAECCFLAGFGGVGVVIAMWEIGLLQGLIWAP